MLKGTASLWIVAALGGVSWGFIEHHVSAEGWTAFATILLALITGGLVYFGFEQAKTTRAQLRAYLFIDECRIKDVGAMGYPEATVDIKNFGQTPAHGVTAIFALELDTYPTPTGKALETPSADELSRSDLGPGSKITVRAARDDALSSPEWDEINGERKALYVIGEVKFTNAFDEEWVSTIRLMHTRRNLGTTNLEICPEGNETRRG
jgi:hypothetical protein